MLTETDYLMAWSVYLLAAVVLMLTVWRLSRPWWGWLRDLLRLATAVVLLLPAAVDDSGTHLAPAVFLAAFEFLSSADGGAGPLLGVRLLLITLFAVSGAWILRLLWFWLVASRRTDG